MYEIYLNYTLQHLTKIISIILFRSRIQTVNRLDSRVYMKILYNNHLKF